jgi:hypothetical protein
MRFIHLQNRNKNEEKIKKHNDLVNKFIPFDQNKKISYQDRVNAHLRRIEEEE